MELVQQVAPACRRLLGVSRQVVWAVQAQEQAARRGRATWRCLGRLWLRRWSCTTGQRPGWRRCAVWRQRLCEGGMLTWTWMRDGVSALQRYAIGVWKSRGRVRG